MLRKQKLELTWIGKDNRPGLVTDKDLFDSRLIFGDNLLALKVLDQELT